ncbi:MAG: hypothetical protein HZA52_06510 [Planctomycetes bacterium]|nr:hypothetical protein [Planctomycetota bacterium]
MELLPPARVRIGIALAVALAADTLFLWTELVHPLALALDAAVAVVLFFLLGARWSLVPVLAVEVFPLTSVFPTWTLAVASLAALSRQRASAAHSRHRD